MISLVFFTELFRHFRSIRLRLQSRWSCSSLGLSTGEQDMTKQQSLAIHSNWALKLMPKSYILTNVFSFVVVSQVFRSVLPWQNRATLWRHQTFTVRREPNEIFMDREEYWKNFNDFYYGRMAKPRNLLYKTKWFAFTIFYDSDSS